MPDQSSLFVGKGQEACYLLPAMATRHGMVAGATGTGKTVTLQILAEGFSHLGVPVFMADVKGDLSGMSQAGAVSEKLTNRAEKIGLQDYFMQAFPVQFWDIFGDQGCPVRTTISDMGPVLLSQLLELTPTQEGVLNIAFKMADDEGLLLLDLKDLRSILQFVAEHSKELTIEYGNVSKASVGAILRRLLTLEEQGGDQFFGEPALDILDLMQVNQDKHGMVNIFAADKLMAHPKLYATFLLWLLSELFEELPEVGDIEKPKLVFFFDEAHLLFDDAPDSLLEKVEQVVRLIRSKGISVFFISQNPLDIPDSILGQCGNRIQHGMRAFTAKDKKAIKAIAETFRENPKLETQKIITELGIGEALVSTLNLEGIPSVVDKVLIRPPSSKMGPISAAERSALLNVSQHAGKYQARIDRQSAHEILKQRAEANTQKAEKKADEVAKPKSRGRQRQSTLEAFTKSVVRSIGSTAGRKIMRGILGAILR